MSSFGNQSPPSMPGLTEYKLSKNDINEALMALQSLPGVSKKDDYVYEDDGSKNIKGYYHPNPYQPDQSDFEFGLRLPRSDLAGLTELLGTGVKGRQPPHKQDYDEPDYLTEKELIQHVKAAAKDLYKLVSNNESVNETIRKYENPEVIARRRKHANKVHTIVNRLYQSHEEKEHKLDMLRRQHEADELASMSQAPTLSEGSRMILRDQPVRPLHKRYLAIQDEREEARFRAQMEAEDRKRDQEAKEAKPLPRNKSARRIGHKNMMEFMRHNEEKQAQKMDELQLMELEKLVAEMDKLTFKPHISANSKKIFERKMERDGIDMKLEDRLRFYEKEKKRNLKQVERQLQPSFTPMINRNTRALAERIRRRGEGEEDEEFDPNEKENRSYLDRSVSPMSKKAYQEREDRRRMVTRSITPTKKSKPETIINVVEYTPEMEFLAKKIIAKKKAMAK